MNERDVRKSKFLQRTTAYQRSSVSASRKRLFEAANYLLCQLALQMQELERMNTNDGNGEQPEQTEEETPE